MHLIVKKTLSIKGIVTLPGSKSQAIRGFLLALLAHGESQLYNVPDSEDIQSAITACKQLGAKITALTPKNAWRIISHGVPLLTNCQTLYSGQSGITTRFLLPLLGLRQAFDQPIVLDCHKQMRHRPIQPLIKSLSELGLTIEYVNKDNRLPVKIKGQLKGGNTIITGDTSQYLSALLLALPCAERNSQIQVHNLRERPYVDMTLNCLKEQNLHYRHIQYPPHCHDTQNNFDNSPYHTINPHQTLDHFVIKGRQSWKPQNKILTMDFSSASYIIGIAALLQGQVVIKGIDMSDQQGDKTLVPILQNMGAHIETDATQTQLTIYGGFPLQGCAINARDIPDLLPTLAVIGTQAQGKTCIYDVPQARYKETDRIHAMAEGLKQLGAKVVETADSLTVYQSKLCGRIGSRSHPVILKGYGDHRTVMALVMAGLLAEGETIIQEAEAINKTFPAFISIMQSLGSNISVHG